MISMLCIGVPVLGVAYVLLTWKAGILTCGWTCVLSGLTPVCGLTWYGFGLVLSVVSVR